MDYWRSGFEMKLNFYRAMSVKEYLYYQEWGKIHETEWVERKLERDDNGINLLWIKKWIDEGVSWGRYDLMIMVEGSVPDEFFVSPHVYPKRYKSRGLIDFSKATVVYDPRCTVSETPILTLEKILKSEP